MKKHIGLFYFILSTLISFAQSDWGEIKWDNGMKVENPDQGYKIKFGGRMMLDGMSVWPEENGVMDTILSKTSGVEFRRIRIYTAGKIYNNILFKLQFDFAGGEAALKDAYVTITKIPYVGNFQIGHFKEPIGLEVITSSNYLALMERGLTSALSPERNTGAMFYNNQLNKRMMWAIGYFLPANEFGQYVGNKYNITGRISGLPLFTDEKDSYKLLHLGLSLSHQYQDNSLYQLKSRPESHLVPTIALAEIDKAKAVNSVGGEVAFVLNRFSVQSEYLMLTALTSDASVLQKSNYNFSAFYAAVSWFITGEHRKYNPEMAAFDRTHPLKNFGEKNGSGAWEVTLRYSDLDLDDTDISGGRLSNITAGVNWYLNPATRFMFNYVVAQLQGVGNIDIFQMRVQVNF